MLNITAVGRLGKDPELRTTQSGQEITKLLPRRQHLCQGRATHRMAVCSIWGKRGEVFRQYVSKGQQVTITGKAFHDTWQGKDGEVNDFCVDVADFACRPVSSPSSKPHRQL